ncbi:MAG: hypothetical protein ACYC6Y_10510 [Thermoguttaceae bacterium]
MAKPQISLGTLLYGVLSAQVALALVLWLDYRNPASSAILLCAIYIIGIGGSYCLARDRRYRAQSLVWDGGHYECPYCGNVMRTKKAFPVCMSCSSQTRSRGPTVSAMLGALLITATVIVSAFIQLYLESPPE